MHGVEQLWDHNITEKLPDLSSYLTGDVEESQPAPATRVVMLCIKDPTAALSSRNLVLALML